MEYTDFYVISVLAFQICRAGASEIINNESKILQQHEEASVIQRLSDLEGFLLPLPLDQMSHLINETVMRYVPVNSESDQCRGHSLLVMESFHQRHLWALRMLDAGTKLMSGVLDGHLQDLGNFEQCINIVHPDKLFHGQHCVIQTAGFLDPNIQLDKEYTTDITFSLCVPSSCSVEDVAAHVDSVLAQVNATTVYSYLKNSGSEFTVASRYLTCSVDKVIPHFRFEDYIALIVFSLIGCSILLCSFVGTSNSKSVHSGYSLSTSFRGLMNTGATPNEIACLNGIRVIFTLTVVAYHRLYGMMYVMPLTRRHTTENFASIAMRMTETSTISLDVFFLMGGLLASYSFFVKEEKKQSPNILKSYALRYFRLMPVLAVMMLFYSTLAIHLSSGPIWPKSAERIEDLCRKYWWTSILQINNYHNPETGCVGPSWYVSCDFQLFVLSPLLLIPLYRKPKLGMFLTSACFLAPVTFVTIRSYINQLYPGSMYNYYELERETNDTSLIDYRGFHLRSCYYVIGIALGYLLFTIQKNKTHSTYSKPFFTLGWTVAGFVLTAYVVLSLIIFHPDHIFKPWFDPLYNGLAKPSACAALAWVIFACSLGHGGIVNSFLSCAAFRPLARLTYGVYLLHDLVITTQIFSVQVVQNFNYKNYLYLLSGDLTICFTLAVLLYLTVEVPCSKLANNLLSGKKNDAVGITKNNLPPEISNMKSAELAKM